MPRRDYHTGKFSDALLPTNSLQRYHPRRDYAQTNRTMLIVHVHIHVKPECVDAFQRATKANASASILEPGIARFDVCQQTDDPTRFVLVEVYRDADAPTQHKTTGHYATWRDTVADMMAEPRTSVKFSNCFPADADW